MSIRSVYLLYPMSNAGRSIDTRYLNNIYAEKDDAQVLFIHIEPAVPHVR